MSDTVQPAITYTVGLDLAQMSDYTALAVLERRQERTRLPAGTLPPATYSVRHLVRFPLGTPYTGIVSQVGQLLNRPERTSSAVRPLRGCALAVDRTGVGAPVCDLLSAARLPARLVPITITAGQRVSQDGGGWHVPKKDLVAALQTLLQARRLRWDAQLPFADQLGKELQSFSVKITAAGNETFEAWREQDHDDLVLAVAIATWLAERAPAAGSPPLVVKGPLDAVRPTLGPRPNGFVLY